MSNSVKEYVDNKAIQESVSAFSRSAKMNLGTRENPGPYLDMAGQFQENGDLILRLQAPKGSEVKANIGMRQASYSLQDRGDGIFEALIPHEDGIHGVKTVTFLVDGAPLLSPFLPVMHYANRTANYVEFPDACQEFALLRDVPHGKIIREIYYSKAICDWVRTYVYTPPGYDPMREKPYPVLYLQHGAGENETDWWTAGKLPSILDNLNAEGKCVPFLVVMNNGMLKAPHESLVDDFDGLEGLVTEDCRRYIEENYNASPSKWDRALAGLSLGSMFTSYAGFRHPELYAYLGIFSGGLRRRDHHNSIEESEHLDTLRHYDFENPPYRLIWMSKGDREGMPRENEMDADFLKACGIDRLESFKTKIYEGGYYHDWGTWRLTLHDFAQLLFR